MKVIKELYGIEMIINEDIKLEQSPLMDDVILNQVSGFHKSLPAYSETPLVSLDALAEKLNVNSILVKDESFRFGLNAFKGLGGSYAIFKILGEYLNIPEEECAYELLLSNKYKKAISEITFVTATDGNHGRGLAWFVTQLGAKSVVLMPMNSVEARVEAIRAAGAEVTVTDLNYDDAVRKANKMAEDNDWIMVQDTAWEGYEKIPTWITLGYTTMTKEIINQLDQEKPTHVILQAGVGSMAGSVLGYLVKHYGIDTPKVIIVEPNQAACIYKSALIGDGNAHSVLGNHETSMAGLACGEPNVDTWKILRDNAFAYISCNDSVTERGMQRLATPLGFDKAIVSGESGAVGMGLLEVLMEENSYKTLRNELKLDANSKVLLISTEGDTDPVNYNRIIDKIKPIKLESAV